MADLVEITDPHTRKTYRVHPWFAEHGEWFARDKAGMRAQLPGVHAFERHMGHELAQASHTSTTLQEQLQPTADRVNTVG